MSHRHYDILSACELKDNATYCHPPEQPVVAHLDDSALSLMTDFLHTQPVIIHPDALLPDGLMEMKACHVHSLLVVNQHKHVIGLITSEDMFGEKPIQVSQERQITRHDIPVRALMTPINHLLMLNYSVVALAKAGNIAHTLTHRGQRYALVIDENDTSQPHIRGIFSASLLSRQLGVSITRTLDQASSIAQLQHDISKDR